MKRFTRYYREPDFRLQVDEQLALAKAATVPGSWITYAIHDPSAPDHIDNRPQGIIRYVGQSKQFHIRVKDRMASAGRAIKRPSDHIDGLLYEIMARGGPAPKWTILERVQTAIDSLVSETNWTTRLRARGYPLVNRWSEQRLGTLDIDRYGVPEKRLWALTAADAIGSDIDVLIHDPATRQDLMFDLTAMPPTTRLQKIRAHASSRGCRARLIVR